MKSLIPWLIITLPVRPHMEVMRPFSGPQQAVSQERRRLQKICPGSPQTLLFSSLGLAVPSFLRMRAHSIWRRLLALVCCSSLPCHFSRDQAVTPACPAALERDQLLRITSQLCPLALVSPTPPSLRLFLAGGILQESQVHVTASVQDRSFPGPLLTNQGKEATNATLETAVAASAQEVSEVAFSILGLGQGQAGM